MTTAVKPERRFLFSTHPGNAWYEYDTPEGDTVQEREPLSLDYFCIMTRLWSLGYGVTTTYQQPHSGWPTRPADAPDKGAHTFVYPLEPDGRRPLNLADRYHVYYGHAVTPGGLAEAHEHIVAELRAGRLLCHDHLARGLAPWHPG